MIRHIFKIIWNERKLNAWLIVEFLIVFCVLWFCCDYIHTITRKQLEDPGLNIEHVYKIEMREKPSTGDGSEEEIDRYALALTLLERVKRHPDIESVSLSNAGAPYGSTWMNAYRINSDSANHGLLVRHVTSEYFDVFKVKVDGRIFDWTDNASREEAIITPFKDNLFGDQQQDVEMYDISQVHQLVYDNEWDAIKEKHRVIGIGNRMKTAYFNPYICSVILPLRKEGVNLANNEILIRVKASADDKNFIQRFSKDMREQLFISPYYLSSISSMESIKENLDMKWGFKKQTYSAYAITLFIVVNIFLGVLGSFWFRTQSRRSEIGLRIALGSSKKKVQGIIIAETIFLLLIAGIVATVICLSVGTPEIIESLGIPNANRNWFGIVETKGITDHIINFALTFGFLALVSIIAVWYPAKQASDIAPAEALHDE
ncbi:ABC transporter permease [Dysgonomonas sp. 25]|uniref:ABC transporter permease n=1 Tax=Dysgonomonas sp. 25 TaxID=2302933 RepID=UPI0013D718DC|nr:FtsX-like permease family protein [Dysgonomonas sp. 25]NDV67878.1 ABC transporter permease [Dysgonomonas sp. 25]